MKLSEMTWPEVAAMDKDRTLVVAPIAACEQHSRHLPTFTDTILCGGIADRIDENLRERVLMLPVQWMGASDHHFPFGATVSAGVDTHVTMLVEILSSMLDNGFKRCLILNGHGGNIDTLHMALRRLQPQYPNCLLTGSSYWEIASKELAALAKGPRKEMGHACEFETSMVMHFRPDLVRTKEIANDHQTPPDVLRGLYVAHDMGQRTNQGCVGYPELASAEHGKRLVDAVVARVTELCTALIEQPIVPGRLDRRMRNTKDEG